MRIIRFIAQGGQRYYGAVETIHPTTARIITGDIFGQYKVSSDSTPIVKVLAPLARTDIKTVRGIGLNYRSHANELKKPIPKFPIVFHKPGTAIIGPDEDIQIHSPQADYEVEIVVVIGKECRDVDEKDASGVIFGYTLGNDISHRDWQTEFGGGQWSYSKGFDGTAPIGPLITTEVDEFFIETRVNGALKQSGSTSDLIFSIPKIISFLSRGTTLVPGDLIFTGTPSGVGVGRNPPEFLRHGDKVVLSSPQIGTLTNRVVKRFAKM